MKKFLRNLRSSFLLFHKLFSRIGLLIVPNHYYSNVPDLNYLRKNINKWAFRSKQIGININLNKQIENLKKICIPYKEEYLDNIHYKEAMLKGSGPGYGFIDAQVLHSIIRYYKPKKIIEIGGGISTYCILKATQLNKKENNIESKINCIEPFPNKELINLAKSNKNLSITAKMVQEIPLDFFEQLKEKDLLFIDSSHTVKTGSDTNFLILEVLPRLFSGVIVHFHDIYFPYDYQRNCLQTFFCWQETVLLHSYLINNKKNKILLSLSQLHYDKQDELKLIFPSYTPQPDNKGMINDFYKPFSTNKEEHFPSSTYLEM